MHQNQRLYNNNSSRPKSKAKIHQEYPVFIHRGKHLLVTHLATTRPRRFPERVELPQVPTDLREQSVEALPHPRLFAAATTAELKSKRKCGKQKNKIKTEDYLNII